MSAAHTPGPWLHDTGGFPAPDVRAESGRAVARTWMVCRSQPKTEAAYQARCEEDRANARLIAAAPELLEALEICAGTLAEFVNCGNAHPTSVIGKNVTRARAAIAKAIGVQP